MPHAIESRESIEHGRHDSAAAMDMELCAVFACEARWTWKEEHQAMVDQLTVGAGDPGKRRTARLGNFASSTARTCVPDSLMTATPDGRRPLESAYIVSAAFIYLRSAAEWSGYLRSTSFRSRIGSDRDQR